MTRRRHLPALLPALALLAALAALPAAAGDDDQSPYGPRDRAGASNLMTELTAIRAANIIRRGRVVELGRDYRPDMPLGPGQDFELVRRRTDTGPITRIDSYLSAPIGQVGTHLDGLDHIGSGGEEVVFYNGLGIDRVAPPDGPGELGIEHVRPIFTRGILIDMVTVRGRAMEAGEEITVADIETALDWFGIAEPGRGDAVVFHTGWGRHWIADNDTFLSGAPGIGEAAAQWLIAHDVALVATDAWSIGRQAPGEAPRAFAVHLALTRDRGILVQENLETERLIDAEIAEFAYIFTPLHVVGASGSPGAPLAVY